MQGSYFLQPRAEAFFRPAIIFGFFIFLLSLIGAHAQEQAKDPQKSEAFKPLVAKLKSGDTTIDFKALRIASVDSKEEGAGEADPDLSRKAAEALRSKKYEDAIKHGEKALKTGYVDIDLHLVMALANREAGDSKKFDFHKAVYLGLLNSILAGADGKSAKTAYVVISVSEEYAVLRALELTRGSQGVRSEDGHRYDVLTVTDSKNATQNVWFNIDIVWKSYEKMFK